MIAIKWEVNPNLISDQLLAHGLLYLLKQLPVGCEVHFLAEIFSYIRCKAGNACNVGIQDAGGLWHVQVEEINHLSVGARCLSALLQATTPFWCTPSVMGPGREQIDVLTEGCRAALSSEASSQPHLKSPSVRPRKSSQMRFSLLVRLFSQDHIYNLYLLSPDSMP